MQGRKSDVTVYNDNPVEVAKEFAGAGAEMIHVVDLDGAFSEPDSPNRAVVENIVESGGCSDRIRRRRTIARRRAAAL